MKERIMWIDEARGLAMLAILLFHTEVYYAGKELIPYVMFVENALALFFFLSGYLFASSRAYSLPAKMKSVLRRLIVPYLFFTLLMAIPKAWVHHNEISLSSILTPIVTGKASWFVATLIIAEIYYALVRYLAEKCCHSNRSGVVWESCCMLSPLLCYLILDEYGSIDILAVTTISLVFIFLGRIYRLLEHRISVIQRSWVLVGMTLLLFFMKFYEYKAGVFMTFFYIRIDSFPLFYADTILSCVLLIALLKKKQGLRLRMLSWTGRHSLVIYFLSGGVPICVAYVMPTYNGNVGLLLVAFLLVWLLASFVAWIVYRFLPWIVGTR